MTERKDMSSSIIYYGQFNPPLGVCPRHVTPRYCTNGTRNLGEDIDDYLPINYIISKKEGPERKTIGRTGRKNKG